MSLAFALRIHDAEIVFGVLVKVLGRDAIAAGLCFPRQRQIPLEHLVGVAADFDVRPVAIEGLDPMRQTRPIVMGTAATVTTA
jgi:hypothetical protein